MPLIKGRSQDVFKKNLDTEMSSGKPKPQALAIALSIRRKAARNKMAHGSVVENEKLDPKHEPMPHGSMVDRLMSKRMADGGMYPTEKDPHYAEGGEVMDEDDIMPTESNPDVFLTEDMADDSMTDEGMEESEDDLEDPMKARRKMLSGIMSGLHRDHLGK